MNDIDKWVQRFWMFDIYTDFSDDHREWKAGIAAKARLKEDVVNSNLTREDKLEILRRVGEISDQSYKESRLKYSCTAEQPLWDEGDGPHRKEFVISYLGLNHEQN